MSTTTGTGAFPWEDDQSPRAQEPQRQEQPPQTEPDPYDPNGVPEPPAEVAPDEAGEHVHADDFAPSDETADEAQSAADSEHAPEGDAVTPRRMEHSRPLVRKEYYAISEVSDLVGLPAHVLRYWESQFSVLNPSKNRSGNRVYQRKEIRLILLVKQLLYEDKYTVEGAKQRLDQLRRGGGLADATARALDEQLVHVLREELATLAELLGPQP